MTLADTGNCLCVLDADGFIVSLDQLAIRARNAPDGARVHAWREASDPVIQLVRRRLEARTRGKRLRVTITILGLDELTIQHDREMAGADHVAVAMNQPTGL